MKKIVVLIVILFFIVSCIFLVKYKKFPFKFSDTTQYDGKYMRTRKIIKIHNILNSSEPNASKILKDFVNKDLEENIDNQEEVNRLQNLIKDLPLNAFEYDLNDDGENEVIGLPPQIIYYFGPWGGSIIILQKKNDKYEKIENHMIYTFEDEIVILKEKTNGYHHMQFRRKGQSEPKHLIKYDKKQKSFRFYFYEDLNKNFR